MEWKAIEMHFSNSNEVEWIFLWKPSFSVLCGIQIHWKNPPSCHVKIIWLCNHFRTTCSINNPQISHKVNIKSCVYWNRNKRITFKALFLKSRFPRVIIGYHRKVESSLNKRSTSANHYKLSCMLSGYCMKSSLKIY